MTFLFCSVQAESSPQNDEWSCSTDDWNYIEQSSITNKNGSQKFNSCLNSDLTYNNYSVPDPNSGTAQSLVNQSRPLYNFNSVTENGQHTLHPVGNDWFDKSEYQHEQINSLQHNVNQDFVNSKCDNIVETDDNFWIDVENREILPPESFQNDSLQDAMNNLQISNEVRSLNNLTNNFYLTVIIFKFGNFVLLG